MKINEIIKEKRLALGYTQEQLAKFLNLTTPAVNKWERGGLVIQILLFYQL